MNKYHIIYVGWRLCEEESKGEAEGEKAKKEGALSSFPHFSWVYLIQLYSIGASGVFEASEAF